MTKTPLSQPRPLQGRTALVTGASRLQGMGAGICRQLAEAGANIFFTYWQAYDRTKLWGSDASEPALLQQELEATGVQVARSELDLSNPDAPAQLIATVNAELGNLMILVNNATYSIADGFEALNARILDATYAVNLRAAALLSVEFARSFTGSTGGRIINLTSGQFQAPMPQELAYAATKGAMDAFTITLAAEVARHGITVNAVNPGPTNTGWLTPDLEPSLLARFPQGRMGTPEDAARLVVFLASDAAEWITGQIVHSEGDFQRG